MKWQTLHGEVDLQEARLSPRNMIVELSLAALQEDFVASLWDNRHVIATTVAQHLNASRPPRCEVLPTLEWIRGSFNMCIPVSVSDQSQVMIRFPLPYKIGEYGFPGNVDEKLLTEAATYAWLDEHSPDVPKPQLLGYALSDGRRVR